MAQSAAAFEPEFGLAHAQDALRQLARARRHNRAASVDVFEGFYQAYFAAFACGIAVLLGSDAVGDVHVSTGQLADVVAHGPAYIGLAIAAVLLVALRSGSRGGPLVLPAADVRHVLLAPLPRKITLRPAAIRQLRFSAFVGMVVGAGLATVAARRFPGGVPKWTPIGAGLGAAAALFAAGLGMVTCGRRVRPWAATIGGLLLLTWSGVDIASDRVTSPMTLFGQLALSAVKFHPVALAVIALPVVLAFVAVAGIGGLSIEQAERRATLASQIRFALTLQDLRTVVLLRRQLTQEQSRVRPWVKFGRMRGGRMVVLQRDLRGLTRWPAVRIARVAFFGIAAAASLLGVWEGTTPLLLVAGLCLFLAALESLEPLAQDIDHPDLPAAIPAVRGELRLRHAPVPLMTMIVVCVIGWGAAVVAGAAGLYPLDLVLPVGAAVIVPAALLATVGAAASVVMEPSVGGSDLMPSEVAGIKMVLRALWSPALALLGLTPLLAARSADQHNLDAAAAALSAGILPLMVGVLGLGWLRFREDLHEYFKAGTPARPPAKAAA